MTVKWVADDKALYIGVGEGWQWSDAEAAFAHIVDKLQSTSQQSVALIFDLQSGWSLPPGGFNAHVKRAVVTIAADNLTRIIFVAADDAALQIFRGSSQLHPIPNVEYHFLKSLDAAYALLG